ncbi:MAG: glutamine--fructose-6-phosphate transaminase (isomerizing) [Solobacterium sp.]|nr:glutamine--fructose-6-phosphate transaminase (isomerizing) [Solobacterium sp.]
MCGIIGYIGTNKTADILLDSLELLEYRGYDSAGVAFCSGKNVHVFKCADRVSVLRELVNSNGQDAKVGIGHTRWATHGSVSYKNSHPHQVGHVTLVHNGIIENYKELIHTYHLENKLVSTGDSEVACALLDFFYQGNPMEAIKKTCEVIEGTYALVMIFDDRQEEIYAIRKVSPIVVSENENERMLASDVMPLSRISKEYFTLPENTILKMDEEKICLFDLDGKQVKVEMEKLDWDIEQIGTQGYPCYMEKEIAEQEEVIQRTLFAYLEEGLPSFQKEGLADKVFQTTKHLVIVACGTSYHAGLYAKLLFEKVARLKTDVYLASEFIYQNPVVEENPLVLVISQSGETIDTLEALRHSKELGYPTLAIVNVKGSSIAKESDATLYTYAGPEIAVASTKAYTCQIMVLLLLVYQFAYHKKMLSKEEVQECVLHLKKVPHSVAEIYHRKEVFHDLAKEIHQEKDLYMIGRGLDYYILLEAALKMKEISYIHTEAYASGELKHGPIALIEEGTKVLSCMTQSALIAKESSNIKEVRARGAKVYGLLKPSLKNNIEQKISITLLNDLPEDLMVFPTIVAFQLLSYYVACEKGLNVDKPRNLAKVVTVE